MKLPDDASLDLVRRQVDGLRRQLDGYKDGDGRSPFDGMDPWQQTLERKLGELRRDTRGLSTDNNAIQSDIAALARRVGLALRFSQGGITRTSG